MADAKMGLTCMTTNVVGKMDLKAEIIHLYEILDVYLPSNFMLTCSHCLIIQVIRKYIIFCLITLKC